MKVKSLSRVRLLVTPWTAAYQAPPSTPAPSKHQSAFCLYGFTESGRFLEIESYSIWPFVVGFFHEVLCFQAPSPM